LLWNRTGLHLDNSFGDFAHFNQEMESVYEENENSPPTNQSHEEKVKLALKLHLEDGFGEGKAYGDAGISRKAFENTLKDLKQGGSGLYCQRMVL